MTKWVLIAVLSLSLSVGSAMAASNAATQARQVVEASEDFFSDVLDSRTDMYWHAGDYPGAVRIIKLQLDIDPNWIEGYDDAAYLLWSLMRFDEAEALYKKGITNNPANYRLYFELGYMYFRTAKPQTIYRKKGKESQALYEKAAQQLYKAVQYPHPPDAGRLLAHSLTALGRHDEAKKAWEGVLKINPTDAIAKRELERKANPQKSTPKKETPAKQERGDI